MSHLDYEVLETISHNVHALQIWKQYNIFCNEKIPGQFLILNMPRQLIYRDMCKTVTWLDP